MAESQSSKFAIMAVAGSAAAIVVALIVVPFLTSAAQQPEGEQRRIVALESKYD
jgi:F0F1-type ATP synthase membrane subunit c/vacuolar-type H+-ATPase subunit K